MTPRISRLLSAAAMAAALALSTARPLPAADEPAGGESAAGAQVFLDKPARIVAYQLKRLTNAQLTALERKTDHPKYKPVYEALLTRKGLDRKFRQEAVDALAKLNSSDPVVEILGGIDKLEAEDKGTLRELISLLMGQKPQSLAARREKIGSLAAESENPTVKEVAYAALAVADGKPDGVWQAAAEKDGGLKSLLKGIGSIPDAKLRAAFYDKVKPLATGAPDEATQVAAIEALGYTPGHEAEAFKLLSDLVRKESGEKRTAAMRAVGRIPAGKWPKDAIEPLAKEIVKVVEQTPADQRTGPAAIQAIQLGNDLAAALPAAQGAPIRKALRDLGVRVVLMNTLREQMQYDLTYFTVQAGKPVQIVLLNSDTMPHNIVVTAPGALQKVANEGAAVAPTGDPNEKAFVPNTPDVLQATVLVQPDESATLSFNAPDNPGEYPYVCTFPGHWVRMYGTMQVVPDLDAYDQNPKPPSDPITKKPFDKQKNELGEGGQSHAEHGHP